MWLQTPLDRAGAHRQMLRTCQEGCKLPRVRSQNLLVATSMASRDRLHSCLVESLARGRSYGFGPIVGAGGHRLGSCMSASIVRGFGGRFRYAVGVGRVSEP